MKWSSRVPMLPHRVTVIAVILICLSLAVPLRAQGETAEYRVATFVYGAQPVSIFIDGAISSGVSGEPYVYPPMTLLDQYSEIPSGEHTLALVPEGGTVESALFSEQALTFEAGHRFLLAFMGNMQANDLHFLLIDETAALEEKDITASGVTFMVNNLYGVPGLDFFFGGKPLVLGLPYGEYAAYQDPTEGKGSRITVMGEPDNVVFEYADGAAAPRGIFVVFSFSGIFPGTMDEDFGLLYVGHFAGEKTVVDGGTIAVGDTVPVHLNGAGERVRYHLDLTTTTTLDIMQSASAESGADAYLRIYNAAGDALFENDELTVDDNSDGVWDAGWIHLTLEPGSYLLEAGAFSDMSAGDFMLSVNAAQ